VARLAQQVPGPSDYPVARMGATESVDPARPSKHGQKSRGPLPLKRLLRGQGQSRLGMRHL